MKRIIAVLLLFAVVVMPACSGGGGDSKYRFDGNWFFNEMISADPYGWGASAGMPVGTRFTEQYRIDQSGTTLVMRNVISGWVYNGICDRKAKTFTATWTDGAVTHRYSGIGEGKETMSGTSRMEYGPYFLESVWTADLIGRGIDRSETGKAPVQNLWQKMQEAVGNL